MAISSWKLALGEKFSRQKFLALEITHRLLFLSSTYTRWITRTGLTMTAREKAYQWSSSKLPWRNLIGFRVIFSIRPVKRFFSLAVVCGIPQYIKVVETSVSVWLCIITNDEIQILDQTCIMSVRLPRLSFRCLQSFFSLKLKVRTGKS